MSAMSDIRNAKAIFDFHCAIHNCKIGQCDQRRVLWLSYMHTAENWR